MTTPQEDNPSSTSSGKGESEPQRSVLGRISMILNAFSHARPELGLAELSALTGLPKSTIHRLAEQMGDVGWIERHEGRYRIAMRMFELGSLAVEGNRLQSATYPVMQALAAKTGLATQLAVLDGTDIVYLERIGSAMYPVPARRGDRMPAYCTGLGKAMIAFDDGARDLVLAAGMARRTDKTITKAEAMMAELHKVQEIGVAFDRGEADERLVCVAAPIRGNETAIGAISLTAPPGLIRWDMAAGAVRTAAAAAWNAVHRADVHRARHH